MRADNESAASAGDEQSGSTGLEVNVPHGKKKASSPVV